MESDLVGCPAASGAHPNTPFTVDIHVHQSLLENVTTIASVPYRATRRHVVNGALGWGTVMFVCLTMMHHGVCSASDLARSLPAQLFTQVSFAERDTSSVAFGAVWPWAWQRELPFGSVGGYSEVVIGRWTTKDQTAAGTSGSTQLGMTPVFRIRPDFAGGRLFVDLGVGVNVITPVFRSGPKHFSTAFNFGDHLAVGTQLGGHVKYTVALRVEHFSNAGLKHPNPGVNFVQLRVSSGLSQDW